MRVWGEHEGILQANLLIMNLIRPMALGLVVTLLAACDQAPAPPEPTPAPEPAAPAVEQPKVPAQPVEVERTVEAKPEQPPAPPRQEARVRAAPPDKAPEAARVLPKAAQKPAPKVEPPPADKLDLRLPDELVQRLEEKVRELEQANLELQRVEKMKSDFVILAGHELRTPLTVVYGYLQILMADRSIPGSAEQEGTPKHLMRRVFEAVERLSQVIQDILNVSLIDANRLDLAHEPVFLNSTIQSVLHNLRSFGSKRDVTIELGSGLRKLPTIEGDPRRLHQAFWNVISNAIKYTPDGGSITIDGEVIDNTVHIWVKDTGVGIPPEELSRIFGRFYVLEDVAYHRSSKTDFKGGGLGLGLAVSKGIIEAHEGKIWAESQGYDETALPGTTMHILLPLGNPFSGPKTAS